MILSLGMFVASSSSAQGRRQVGHGGFGSSPSSAALALAASTWAALASAALA